MRCLNYMKMYTKELLDEYLKDDWILELIKCEKNEFSMVRTNKWLEEIEAKRMIYADIYGDILRGENNVKVLDVGGGVNVLTKKLACNCDYTLLDFLAHGGKEVLNDKGIKWMDDDWSNVSFDQISPDIIIANDIFPDVDQRLELFIEKSLKTCKELRLVLTFYNSPQYYLTKRVDDLEMMTFLSWDGEITALKLKKYLNDYEADIIMNARDSIFRNGRQVAFIKIKA